MTETSRKKPKKPYPSFPLTAHPNGQLCKQILGEGHFFGVGGNPDAALEHYQRIAADLHAGREPASADDGQLTVKELGNQYLAYQMGRVSTGQIGPRWFEDCRRVLRQFARNVGTAITPAILRVLSEALSGGDSVVLLGRQNRRTRPANRVFNLATRVGMMFP